MTTPDQVTTESRPQAEERLNAYRIKLTALKERSSLREVMERELLLEFIKVNHGGINEFPLLKAQQKSVVELLCARSGHPGYEFIHKHIANFIVLLAHYGKAVKVGDTKRTEELYASLINTESILLKCVQGIVYAMALITDNFEEIVLRFFGQSALQDYSELIERFELNDQFWKAFVEQFIASRVHEAHKEIIEGERYDISKEKNFLIIRFLFDDILAKLKPTGQSIEKTRIQKSYLASLEGGEKHQLAKFTRSILTKGMSDLTIGNKLSSKEIAQAARITCIDKSAAEFDTLYREQALIGQKLKQDPKSDYRDKDTIRRQQVAFKFTMDQVVAVGVGACIAIGMTTDHLYRALQEFVPEQIAGIKPLAGDFSMPVLERILFFLMENHTIHMLTETGRDEGGKIQVRSGRARRVAEAAVDGLPGMSKIRKKQLFGKDVTREGMLLFKPKSLKQMTSAMSMLSLEPELQQSLTTLWNQAVFRVDIMVLINLELVARTTTNLKAKLGEILDKYGVSRGD